MMQHANYTLQQSLSAQSQQLPGQAFTQTTSTKAQQSLGLPGPQPPAEWWQPGVFGSQGPQQPLQTITVDPTQLTTL